MSDTASNSSIFTQINNKLGEASETLDNLTKFLDKTKVVLDKIGEVALALKVTVGILSALDLFGNQKSEMDMLFDKIHGLFTALMNKIDAQSKHLTQIEVADRKGDADAVVGVTKTYLVSHKSKEDSDLLKGENSKSRGAITDLMQEPLWQRTFNENALTSLKWGDAWYKPPVNADNLVWDYRLTLPSLLAAISARIFYLTALNPLTNTDFRDKGNHDEINEYADYLKNTIYPTMYAGIVRTPAPLPKLMSKHVGPFGGGLGSVNPHLVDSSNAWEAFNDRSCGAVDTYSGLAMIQNLPFGQPTDYTLEAAVFTPDSIEEKERVYRQKFYFLFALRTERAFQQVYEKMGLPALWNFIGQLKQMTGESFPSAPPEQGYSLRKVINSPIRKIIQIRSVSEPFTQKEEPLNLDIKDSSGRYSLRHMGRILGPDLSSTLPAANPGGDYPVSLRVMLAGG